MKLKTLDAVDTGHSKQNILNEFEILSGSTCDIKNIRDKVNANSQEGTVPPTGGW